MFQLTTSEIDALVSQFVIPHKGELGGAKPFVFTERGVVELNRTLKKNIDISSLFNKPKQDLVVTESYDILSKISVIRGLSVMFDFDLAQLYGVKAVRLREQVKRNQKRFPPDFMYQLTDEEISLMVSQNAIPSKQTLGGSRPFVFTEQGIASISSVLNSEKAIEVNIAIIRAFVAMRKMLVHNTALFQRVENIETRQLTHQIETDKKIDEIFSAIEERGIKPTQGIFYNGQIFDAYLFVMNIIRSARQSIILIDNYIDETVLTMLSKRAKAVLVTVYTKKINKQLSLDIQKYNEQYTQVEIIEFFDAHDRFMIIDESEVYHLGASLKDVGKKWFAFSKMDVRALDMIHKLHK
ncbi:ORF6N domain-containing protein [bacterium]|nr:ORF6N domain-containing protein [bacterium]